MTKFEYALTAILTYILGLLCGYLLQQKRNRKHLERQAIQLQAFSQSNHQQFQETVLQPFQKQTLEALQSEYSRISKEQKESFLQLAETQFTEKQKQIQASVEAKNAPIATDLKSVRDLMQTIKNDHGKQFTAINEQFNHSQQITEMLRRSTQSIELALSNRTLRGSWGEKMAEDILQILGFKENIQYIKQRTTENDDGQPRKPDFTFFLPNQKQVHMDVKFPLDNYLKYCDASTETEMQQNEYKKRFLQDTKNIIKSLSNKDYNNPKTQKTIDYIILFIPNEQVFHFLNKEYKNIIDDTLEKKILLSSPTTLYAILSIIRQSIENFNIQETAGQIHQVLSQIEEQWKKFTEHFDKTGRHITSAQKSFEELTGTRKKALDRPFRKVAELKQPKTSNNPELTFTQESIEA